MYLVSSGFSFKPTSLSLTQFSQKCMVSVHEGGRKSFNTINGSSAQFDRYFMQILANANIKIVSEILSQIDYEGSNWNYLTLKFTLDAI